MSTISNIATMPPELLAERPSYGGNTGVVSSELQEAKREEKAYKDFEKMFVHMMLKEMRKTINETSLVEKSHATKMYEEMMDEALAEQMAQSGQMGIAAQLRSTLEAERVQRDLRVNEKIMTRGALESIKA